MRISLLYFFLITFFSIACTSTAKKDNGKPTVVTTTGMIGDAIKNITGDKIEVISLMGPGVDPHLYKATQGDLGRLNRADVVYYNGLYLEGKMADVFEKLGRLKPVVALGEELDKSLVRRDSSFQNAYDPHVWFDVSLWKQVVEIAKSDLQERFPELSDKLEKNTSAYTKKLDSLHLVAQREISTIPMENRVLITSHDAFGYFGRAYDMDVRGLQGLSTATEFGLKDITDLVDFIIERKITAVFIETSVSQKAINAVVKGCNQKGWDVKVGGTLYGDAMGADGTPEGTYIGMVDSNIRTIVEALNPPLQ